MIAFVKTTYIAGILALLLIPVALISIAAILTLPTEIAPLSAVLVIPVAVALGNAASEGWDHMPKKENK